MRLITGGNKSFGTFVTLHLPGKFLAKDTGAGDVENFVGVHVSGPTRIGHYFIPAFATASGAKGKVDQGPVLTPGKPFEWSLFYDPAANGGNGEMGVTFGTETVTLALKPPTVFLPEHGPDREIHGHGALMLFTP